MTVHGYSLLRTTLNSDYFHDLYDEAEKFGIEIEGHRELLPRRADVSTLRSWQTPRLDLGCLNPPWDIPKPTGWQTMHVCLNSWLRA